MEGTQSAAAPQAPTGGAGNPASGGAGGILPSPPLIPAFPPRTAPSWTLPFPMPDEMFEAVQKIMADVERQTNAAEAAAAAAAQGQLAGGGTDEHSDSGEEEADGSSVVLNNAGGASGSGGDDAASTSMPHSFWLSPPAVLDAITDEYDDVLHGHAAKSRNPIDVLSTVESNAKLFAPEYQQGIRSEAKKLSEAQQKAPSVNNVGAATTSLFQRGLAAAGSSSNQLGAKPSFDTFIQQQQQHYQQRMQSQMQQPRSAPRAAPPAAAAAASSSQAAAATTPTATSKSPPDSAGMKRKRSKHGGVVPKQKIARGELWECKVCKKDVKPNKMREHVGSHIMDEGCTSPDACGFCGRSGTCQVNLVQGSAKNIQVPFSQCEYYYKFNLKSALKDQSACSNVPYQCPACHELERKTFHVWKYNMRSHLRQRHPRYAPSAEFLALINVTSDEQSRMREYNTSGYGGADYDDDD
jgi:hypothetical protein